MKKKCIESGRFSQDDLISRLELMSQEPISLIECKSLKGDASDRNYYRAIFNLKSSPEMEKSIVIMQLAKLEQNPDFNCIQKFLKKMDVPVPEIFYFDQALGLLFLMDCGDIHLVDKLKEEPERALEWYQRAIEIIVTFHTSVTENIPADSPAHSLFFDEEKLTWEMDFMLQHYVDGLLMNTLEPDKKKETRLALITLCRELSKQDRFFTHRDYHARNIMIQNDKLTVIDFQDARMGPCQYDLVSLLKDSYITLEDPVRDALVEFYLDRMEQHGKKILRGSFYKIFDWMSVQRNLKAIGTFAYQYKILGNDRYLQYIEPTLNYVRHTLSKRQDLEFLIPILNSAIPTLNAK